MSKEKYKRTLITTFSIKNCECYTCAKTLIKKNALSHQKNNVESCTNKRNDMHCCSNIFAAPQLVFVNVLIGGCDKLDECLDDNENVSYEDLITDHASADADNDRTSFEFDGCLHVLSYPPTMYNEEPLRHNEDNFHYLKLLLAKDSSSTINVPEHVQVADFLVNDITFV